MSIGGGDGYWVTPGAPTPPPGWSGQQPPPSWPAPTPPPPPPGWGAAPAAPRPGIIPLRPLSVGELLDGAFTAMRRYPRVTLGLAAVVAAVQQLLGFAVDASTGKLTTPTGSGFSGVATASGLLTTVVNAVLSAVLLGMLTLVIGDAVLGRPITWATVWAKLRPRFWALLGAAFLATILTYLGLIACIIGFFFPWTVFAFTTPALLLERLGVMDALRRSWRLALPAFWRVLGIRLLAALIAYVITFVLAVPALLAVVVSVSRSFDTGSPLHFGLVAEAAIRLSGLVAATVTAPFAAGVLALLYIDRRMRAEALDLTLVRAAAETTTA